MEDKFKIALEKIAALQTKEPWTAKPDAYTDFTGWGNEDDAFQDGRKDGLWDAAEIAREALK